MGIELRSHKKQNLNRIITRVFFLLPAILFILYAVYIPFGWNTVLSFQEWNGFSDPKWAGLNQYRAIFEDPVAVKSLGNSVFIGLFSTIGAVFIGLALAAFVYHVYRREGAFYRLILFMPVMLPSAIVGLLFVFMFNAEMGLINNVLRVIGLKGLTKAWLENRNTVLWCLVFVNIWKMSGLTMMLAFAAMQTLPTDIFESSRLDGASTSHQFFHLILPLIQPTILLSAVYSLAVNFKSYDIVWIMTKGGPGTTSHVTPIYMIKTGFTFGKFGFSAAQGMVLAAIVMLIVVIIKRVFRSEKYEY
jgi:raffinose/stachyose/melibiose transport system permease protein